MPAARIPSPIPPVDPARDPAPRPLGEAATPCVGRDAELAAIRSLLLDDGARLLTLTGTAGVGKTRLAIETARGLAEGATPFAAVHLVPLAAVTDPETVVAEIAKAIGLRDGGGVPLLETIGQVLQERRTLLVLDTFEHVTAASGDLASLLETCPDLSILVTSRTPLHLYGEQQMDVNPLPAVATSSPPGDPTALPAAVELFVARLRAADPDLALTSASHARIAEICARLEGIPLAIELAASRTRDLGLSQLQDRLDRGLHVLREPPTDAPERRRSMYAAIAWSYDLLPPEDQTLLRWLSVFPGGFTASIAEAMGTPNPDRPPLASLASLVDSSLARSFTDSGGEVRFTFFDAVREFGTEQLGLLGEREAAHRQMATALIAFAREVEPHLYRGRQLTAHLSRIDGELNNLRAAMAWADAHAPELLAALYEPLGQYWLRRSMLHEGRAWAERILAHGDAVAAPLRLRALIDRARMMTYQGDPAVEAAHAEATLLARRLGDPDRELDIIASRIVATLIRREYTAVSGLLERARQIERDHPAPVRLTSGRPQSIRVLGAIASMEQGHLDTALALVRECQIVARVEQDEAVTMIASRVLGGIQSSQGYHAEAVGHFQQALRSYVNVGERWTSAVTVLEIGWEFIEVRPEVTARLFGVADHLMASIGHPPIEALRRPPRRWQQVPSVPRDPDAWLRAYEAGLAEPIEAAIESILQITFPDPTTSSARRASQAPVPTAPRPAPTASLSRRERDVLALIADGRTDREIAAALGISYRTTTTYVANIFAKLNVSSRAGAAARFVWLGLDRPDA